MATEAEIDALIASTPPAKPAHSEADIDRMIAEAHGKAPEVGPLETYINRAADNIPLMRPLVNTLASVPAYFARHGGVRLGKAALDAGMTQPESPGVLDAYRNVRSTVAERDAAGADQNPKAALLGTGTGIGLSLLAPIPKVALGSGRLAKLGSHAINAGMYGVANGLTNGPADLSRGEFGQALNDAVGYDGLKRSAQQVGQGNYGRAALELAGAGGVGSAITGAGLGTAIEAAAPQVSKGLSYLGNKVKDAAGKLKVNSLRPTPTLGEAMEALPGGRAGVGRELLKRNIGGLTKHSTAAQIERELDATGSSISDVARKYDASGGAPLELTRPIDRTLEHAEQLSYEPTTRPAAERLAETVNEYRDTYGSAPVSATDALKFKRTLGDAAYEAGDQLQRSGDHVAGRYGKGLGGLERGVNSELETALGPEFAQANLSYRRLLGAGQAADRGAARVHSNHPLGLIPMVAGAGGAAHGAKEGLGAMAAAMLVNKYGSQAGARALYGVGNALESGAMRSAAESPNAYTRALIEALRRRQEAAQMTPVAAPMFAQGDSHEQE